VLEQEKIEADDAAVALVAREAAGSLRDGMSLLDQAIAWGGEKLVGEEVSRVLGVAARSVLHDIARSLIAGDAAACLRTLAALSDQGYDMGQVSKGILAELRDLVVAKVCKEPDDLLDLADEEAKDVKELAAASQADDLLRLHHGFSRAFDDMVRSAQPRAALEMLLVRLAHRPPLVPLDDLVTRLVDLEKRLSSGSPAPQGPSRSVPGGQGGPPRGPSRPSGSAPTGSAQASSASAPVATSGPSSPTTPIATSTASSTSIATSTPITASSAVAARSGASPASAFQLRSVPAPASAEPAVARPAALDAWRAVLERVRADRAPLASVLEHASPIAFSAERVVLGYEPGSFLAAQATDASAVELLTRHVRDYFGTSTPVAFDLTAGPKSSPSIAAIDGEQNRARLEQARRAVAEHPLVKAAVEILGAELRDVRLNDS
jgi:DNA polymerase-3 subunit gamma/tau